MKLIRLQILFLILLVYTFLIVHPFRITIGDLGRHLKNGEIIVNSFSVPRTNLFTYTNHDFPFINHHWGFGVVSYLTNKIIGLNGLQIIFILLSLITFLIFFEIAWKYGNFYLASLLSILILPLLASRPDIRPEIFSNLFSGIFLWVLINYQQKKISAKYLLLLPIIQLLWVNLHIYFFLGLVLIATFAFEGFTKFFINRLKTTNYLRNLFLILLALSLVSLINPAGIEGALYPLRIFNNYGFEIGENTSAFTLQNITGFIPDVYFIPTVIIFLMSSIMVCLQLLNSRKPIPIAMFAIGLIMTGLGSMAIRNFTIFGYFMLPIIAINIWTLVSSQTGRIQLARWIPISVAGLLILMIIYHVVFGLRGKLYLGIGLEKNEEKAAQFFLDNKISGSIFNDFDIGGYLVYYLYPKYQLFIDNRPEAVPTAFFKDTYIPILEDNKKWQAALDKYNFNVIFFYRLDRTKPAIEFLINRIKDPEWKVVYVDTYSIVFLRKNDINKEIIQKYQIPSDISLIYASSIKKDSHETVF